MGLFIRRLFWLILVLASGLVAALIAGKQYGINIDINSWAKISGLHEISGVVEIINKIPVLLDYPIIKSYGFYSSLGLFLFFMLIFTISLRSKRNNKTEVVHTQNIKADLDSDSARASFDKTPDKIDSAPDTFGETLDVGNTTSEFIAETNSDAVVGTDGKIYDGTATFNGTGTYDHIDARSQSDTGAYATDEYDVEDDSLAQTPTPAADERETGLSHLTDAELKSKTLNLAEEIRSFEADYQSSRDDIAAGLSDFSSEEGLNGAMQNAKDTYQQKQVAFTSEFENKYKPEAVAVRHEISKRLGMSEPYNNFSPVIDSGMLVGINPLAEVADLIEELVNELA